MARMVNFVLFQAGWFACVLGGAYGLAGTPVAVAAALIAVHILLFSANRRREVSLVLMVALIGFCMDSANLACGVFALRDEPRFPYLCPPWLTALWGLFATTLRGSLGWLAGRYGLAALLGAAGGPLSYWGGAELGAVTLPAAEARSLVALAAGWAIVMPLLVRLAHGPRAAAERRTP